MQALDVLDHALQWETERQNRLLRSALEQKKKRRADETRRDFPRQQAGGDAVPAPADTASRRATVSLVEEWADKLRRIPDIRSALIPLDEESEGSDWSLPFSVSKVDMEPWGSFMNGYNTSRLFLDAPPAAGASRAESHIDYAVRALLELKRAPVSIILEPPVQINRQLEFHDLESELRNGRDPEAIAALLKVVGDGHDKQLALAVEQGRTLGNRLYDAMMGEGHANLIRSWEKVYQRKPSVEELHLMLTTGRVRMERRRAPPPVIPSSERAAPSPQATRRKEVAIQGAVQAARSEMPAVAPTAAVQAEPVASPAAGTVPSKPGNSAAELKKAQIKRVLWFAFHAAVSSAAVVAYVWLS